MFDSFVSLLQDIYQTDKTIALHEPRFHGKEKDYLLDVIDSTFVSSVGVYVNQFEAKIAEYCGADFAIATVNGTSALHLALLLAGVKPGEQVLTQAMSFVATANAIVYCGAEPIFLDVDRQHLGLSATHLAAFLAEFAEQRADGIWNKKSGKRIAACLPMHTFGHPCDIEAIMQICQHYNLPVVEDAAEALGSTWHDQHCGTFGLLGVLSFNGNKIITSGAGGMILTNDAELAKQAKHLSTTAKCGHAWQFVHDQIGYNYRMSNLHAALGLAQLEQLPNFLQKKRLLAERYILWAKLLDINIVIEPEGACSNYWLNTLILSDSIERDQFLAESHARGIMTRPLWTLLANLPMYQHCQTDALQNSRYFSECLVNIPSSVV